MSIGLDDGVIFDERDGRIVKTYRTFRGAKIAFTRKYANDPNMTVCTYEYYQRTGAIKANEMVKVKSLVGGKEVEIRRVDVGGCCDPSTERYWSM